METAEAHMDLTPALEDYLETILELLHSRKVVRVRDIAAARNVKPGSVSPAMRRLGDLGLIKYRQRAYIELTEAGEIAARRVMARHRVLRRFFGEVLGMAPAAADQEACAIEHSLSNDAMDRLVRLFEFMQACPDGRVSFIDRFHDCPLADTTVSDRVHPCERGPGAGSEPARISLLDIALGCEATVQRVNAEGAIRQRLLDMGIIPGATIGVERTAPGGDPVWVKLFGSQLALRRKEAEAILVREA